MSAQNPPDPIWLEICSKRLAGRFHPLRQMPMKAGRPGGCNELSEAALSRVYPANVGASPLTPRC